MTEDLTDIVCDLVKRNNEDDLGSFSDISLKLQSAITLQPEYWLDIFLSNIQLVPTTSIDQLIEFTFDKLEAKGYEQVFSSVYEKSNCLVKEIIIDKLALLDHIESLRFLKNLDVEGKSLEISRIISMVLIENSIESMEIEELLTTSYLSREFPPEIEEKIWICLKKVYKCSLPLNLMHQEFQNRVQKSHFEYVIKVAKSEYKNGKYKRVVKLLDQFNSDTLSDYASKLLDISKRKIQS